MFGRMWVRLLAVSLAGVLCGAAFTLYKLRRAENARLPEMFTGCAILRKHNAAQPFGKTGVLHRMPSPIPLDGPKWLADLLQKTGVHVSLHKREAPYPPAGVPPAFGATGGIYVRSGVPKNADGSPGCGQAVNFHKLNQTMILLPAGPAPTCPGQRAILLHETIHALGFAGHFTQPRLKSILHHNDKHWPPVSTWASPVVDYPLKQAIQILYNQPEGEDLSKVCPVISP